MCLVPTKATDSPDGADRADRLQLALCLPSGADNPDRRRIGSREVLGRDSGGRSSPLLSKSVGLNHGDKLSGRHVEQVDPKANSRARRRKSATVNSPSRGAPNSPAFGCHIGWTLKNDDGSPRMRPMMTSATMRPPTGPSFRP